ncbi:hypothetical protein [Ammoniphilus resinae]|uniref:Uncharacterized protein n=1 Tax=Ammoniphilus resinae TaxID=861532 RepID=A0ABS4GKZ0_9BACL|nr:hypothetical protein [Ammoniphilus resinae]MBP1930909.1 hypothetical protein [Ammoniphilus resinae]
MRMKSLQYLLSLTEARQFDVKQMLSELGNDPTVDQRVLEFQEELDTIQHTLSDIKLQIRKGRED